MFLENPVFMGNIDFMFLENPVLMGKFNLCF